MKRLTTTAMMALVILALAASVAYAASITCKPGPGDCNGTKAVDIMSGTPGKDRMHGFQRGDEMSGLASRDKLSGGPGADTITPGAGRDRVFAGRGNDTIDARDGRRDVLVCGKGERDVVKADEVDAIGNTCEVKRVSK
jgi:hypothetical protein